ncbi:fructokinase-like 2 [Euphorbia peplus]|nr:fructokinase-like 2 [Euphorbia peplus]
MASLSFPHLLSLSRCHSICPNRHLVNFVQVQDFRLQNKWGLAAISRKKISDNLVPEEPTDVVKKKTPRKPRKTTTTSRTRKKSKDITEETPEVGTDVTNEESTVSTSSEEGAKKTRRTRRKDTSATSTVEEEKTVKKTTRRKSKKAVDEVKDEGTESEISDSEESPFIPTAEDESDGELELDKVGGEDISHTYGWPPLVCCFGAAQHAFVPSGRRANRLIDYEIHERMEDALWAPERYVRAPGGSAGSVAIALATLGGKVAFMGKLGDDEYGQSMLYYLNVNNVQTRSVRMDIKRPTAVSQMKIAKRGRLRMTCVKPCAEDSLTKSEINFEVLKEAKMLYLSTHSLLEKSMRSATLQAIKTSKKLGGVIFYDVNLPMPLWHSTEETKLFIQEVWNQANVIELTKQELEFLCGITPTEEFDTKNNASSKFVHYGPEVIAPLWHDNLKVLFVTNGTSKIHYYTKEHNGSVLGMEDAPITPFTCDMSASGDGIVAAIMRMFSVHPNLITDKGYIEHTIKYAIDCGVIDQWLLGRRRGFPPRDDMEEEDYEEEDIEPDPNGIISISEKRFRTVAPVS